MDGLRGRTRIVRYGRTYQLQMLSVRSLGTGGVALKPRASDRSPPWLLPPAHPALPSPLPPTSAELLAAAKQTKPLPAPTHPRSCSSTLHLPPLYYLHVFTPSLSLAHSANPTYLSSISQKQPALDSLPGTASHIPADLVALGPPLNPHFLVLSPRSKDCLWQRRKIRKINCASQLALLSRFGASCFAVAQQYPARNHLRPPYHLGQEHLHPPRF
jgi:hypothetical protein